MRYTDNGTIFYKDDGSWAIQLKYVSGAGSPFKVIAWATWNSSNMPFGFQETNEPIDMYGWKIASEADIVLYANREVSDKLEKLKALVRLGYKGCHSTSKMQLAEIEWRMNS